MASVEGATVYSWTSELVHQIESRPCACFSGLNVKNSKAVFFLLSEANCQKQNAIVEKLQVAGEFDAKMIEY